MTKRAALYVGLMSGTSQDGVDAALLDLRDANAPKLLASASVRYPIALRGELLNLASTAPALSAERWCDLDAAVAKQFVRAAQLLLRKSGTASKDIAAIGSHGQTVYHATDGQRRHTLQLGDPNRIAAATGITTVADFRRKDMALGGQGAPLVPAFHAAVFAHPRESRAVLNLGGIANVTLLPRSKGAIHGFDTGPANALMDEWIQRHQGRNYDNGGRWGGSGTVHGLLLESLLADPWFRKAPPKSTGRGAFNLAWVRRRYPRLLRLPPKDVQATFAELTARSIGDALRRHGRLSDRLLVCGGGARNQLLMRRLAAQCDPIPVQSTADYGLDPQWVEAAAFAWLAKRSLLGQSGNVPSATGAREAAILGGIYRA